MSITASAASTKPASVVGGNGGPKRLTRGATALIAHPARPGGHPHFRDGSGGQPSRPRDTEEHLSC
ncbi:hypothetical protein GCM10012319_37060 [Comamonas sp. KCTC 72670]|nr:hypothetical protein GCM10012319_37060 [Comamonas sp. KCTC 72670]